MSVSRPHDSFDVVNRTHEDDLKKSRYYARAHTTWPSTGKVAD